MCPLLTVEQFDGIVVLSSSFGRVRHDPAGQNLQNKPLPQEESCWDHQYLKVTPVFQQLPLSPHQWHTVGFDDLGG